MHKAQKEIRQVLSGIDVIIELLDARIPFSSQNPMLAQIRGTMPCIKLLHKQDLADPILTQVWTDNLSRKDATQVIATSLHDTNWVKFIAPLCTRIAPVLRETRPVHALIVGIPNVGKSTVINLLAGRSIAKTGNEPAITRAQQRVDIGKGVVLRDTPGVLWPNLENRSGGFRLAVTGAIRDTAIDSAEVAAFATDYLTEHYPQYIEQRYNIKVKASNDAIATMEQIGQQRGALARGAVVDFDRVGKLILTDLRTGNLGRLSLETPAMMNRELEQLAALTIERENKDKKRKLERQAKRVGKRKNQKH